MGTQLHSLKQTIVAAYFFTFRKTHRISVFTECRLLLSTTVIEIKSPDDTLDEVIGKCLEYSDFGVTNIVVLDPDNRRQYLFQNNALQLVSSITLNLPKSGVQLALPVNDLAELDQD